MDEDDRKTVIVVGIAVFVVILLISSLFAVWPVYKVWKQEMNGKADLAEAEWSKQIMIEEAKAELESATLKAQSEIERAKGVAEANRIIGSSLKDNDAYLRYLWINGLQDGSSEVIYILEATRSIKTIQE